MNRPEPANSDVCGTCGYTYGEHTGALCPGAVPTFRTWTEQTKFVPYWPHCEKCHAPFDFDEDEPFAHCRCGTTEWGNPRPYDWVPNPRTLLGPHLTHEDCDQLIGMSDGTWHEDVFNIEGPALIELLRRCRSSAFRPKHGVPDGFTVDLPNVVHGAFWAMAQGRQDYVVSAFRMHSEAHGTMLVLAATEEAVYLTKEQVKAFFGLIEAEVKP